MALSLKVDYLRRVGGSVLVPHGELQAEAGRGAVGVAKRSASARPIFDS